MLQAQVIGFLGADAEVKGENGKEFTTFRVAHTERWVDGQGNQREATQWVDVIMSGKPKVAEYLKRGQLVFCSGHVKLRCYSSAVARSFVAGMTISAHHIELLAGQSDLVPSKLYTQDGAMHQVNKYYYTDCPGAVLTNGRGKQFVVDNNGWVSPLTANTGGEQCQTAGAQSQQPAQDNSQQQVQNNDEPF